MTETSQASESVGGVPRRVRVTNTQSRNHNREYIAQVHEDLIAELFASVEYEESGFILVRNPDLSKRPEIHVRYQKLGGTGECNRYEAEDNEDLARSATESVERARPLDQSHSSGDRGSTDEPRIGMDEIGLDFTLRYSLGVAANTDIPHGDADRTGIVEVEPSTNQEPKKLRRLLNGLIGVRPQLCRVRMGVLPDLENKVCRLPEHTMQIIGIEEGDYVCIESSTAIIRGVKAFAIDQQVEQTKDVQKKEQSEHYVDCWEALGLSRLRKPEVDIPEIFIDSETRHDLRLPEREANNGNGVCQPVRVYRDSVGVLTKSAHQIAVPIALVLVAQGIRTSGLEPVLWFSMAVVLLLIGYLIRHRSMLDNYGLGGLPGHLDRVRRRK